MTRKPDSPCAGCGNLLWGGRGSLPAGERMCRKCRAALFRECSVEGCESRHAANGFCRRHGWSLAPALKTCTIDGCDSKHRARGLCANHYRQARYSEGHPAYIGGGENNARGRARRHGVAFEPINRVDVFMRDEWLCGICSLPVDPTLAHPDSMSASLDHIVPMSLGGPHLYANVQCSHLICNIRKRDRLGVA